MAGFLAGRSEDREHGANSIDLDDIVDVDSDQRDLNGL